MQWKFDKLLGMFREKDDGEGPQGPPGVPGTPGVDGTDGIDGLPGVDGVGVPLGGILGQKLVKSSSNNFETEWKDDGKFGDIVGGNYSMFEGDGTLVFNGDAIVFDDMLGNITNIQSSGPGVSFNSTELTIDFTNASNLNDLAYISNQMNHSWKSGSYIYPHIHWHQSNNNIPHFLMRYRWQKNNLQKTTVWTDYKCDTNAFSYVSGTLNQISHGIPVIPPVGYGISDIVQIKLYRDNANTSGLFSGADPYIGTVSITSIDFHYEKDTVGSRTEFTK